MKECICNYCSKTFKTRTRGKDSNKYCSRECAFAERKANIKVKTKKMVMSVCVICSKQFEGRSNSKYCSDECNKEQARIKAREYWKTNKAASVVNRYTTKICKECGNKFTINFMANTREYCSIECARKRHREDHKQQRKEQLKKAFVERVYFKRIYFRDNGTCQICNKPVAYDKNPKDPMGATIDHITPLSKGGKHHPDNCQLAHRRCNSFKGANIDYKIEA